MAVIATAGVLLGCGRAVSVEVGKDADVSQSAEDELQQLVLRRPDLREVGE